MVMAFMASFFGIALDETVAVSGCIDQQGFVLKSSPFNDKVVALLESRGITKCVHLPKAIGDNLVEDWSKVNVEFKEIRSRCLIFALGSVLDREKEGQEEACLEYKVCCQAYCKAVGEQFPGEDEEEDEDEEEGSADGSDDSREMRKRRGIT